MTFINQLKNALHKNPNSWEIFCKKYDVTTEERNLNIQLTGKNNHLIDIKLIRMALLESELEDFETLKFSLCDLISIIDNTQKTVLTRYKIETRNTFDTNTVSIYKLFLLIMAHWRHEQVKKIPFYDKRLYEIHQELGNLETELKNLREDNT